LHHILLEAKFPSTRLHNLRTKKMTSNTRIHLTALLGAFACAIVTFGLSFEPTFSAYATTIA
jgi:hypothetical protein